MRANFLLQLQFTLLTPLVPFASLVTAGQDSPLPAGTRRQAVEKVRSGCHEMDTVIMVRRTKIGWEEMVSDMAARGATGSDEELSALVRYLMEFFGKVNVIAAPAEDLEKLLGLEGKEAQAIVDHREKNGKFKDLEHLKKVPGVSGEKLEEKQPSIAFNQ
jgi:competence ComEA-like helix-hairpin-helix protein